MPGVLNLNPDSILYDQNGNAVGVVLDGSIYRLQVESKMATGHGLATEAKQDTLEATLTEIEADTDNLDVALSTRATEATLAAIEADTDNLDVPLSNLATEDTLSGLDTKAGNILTELQQKTEPSDLQSVVLYDASGNPIAVTSGVEPTVKKAIMMGGLCPDGKAQIPGMKYDENEAAFRLLISGKVQTVISPPPADATSVSIAADNPLDVNGSHDTSYVITNGKAFYIQQLVAGAEGDPTEKGSKVEVIFDNGTEHVIERVYLVGFTEYGAYPDTNEARDGTSLVGNGTNAIVIRRTRLGGSKQEIDAVIRGYEQ